MFLNYLKISMRGFVKQKIYSFITLSGLVIGLALFILAALIADFTYTFDTYHENIDRIHLLVQVRPSGEEENRTSVIQPPVVKELSDEFPEVEAFVRLLPFRRKIVKAKDNSVAFLERQVWLTDENFLNFFTYELISGNAGTALLEPNSAVITETVAVRHFGHTNPLGKILTIDNKYDVKITAVTKDVPDNSSFTYDILLSKNTVKVENEWNGESAGFVLLREGIEPAQLASKFPGFIDKHFADTPDKPKRLYLFPLQSYYMEALDNNIVGYFAKTSPYGIYMLFGAAVVILLVVCVNFMNLSTARYLNRAKEVGVRKVVGANRSSLLKQFLGESIIISFVVLPAALLVFDMIRRVYLASIGGTGDLILWDKPDIIALVIGSTLLTGLIAGSYPAIFLSSFKPVQVLKGNFKAGNRGHFLRKTLVVFQFSLTIIVIVFTFMLEKQFSYLLDIDLGYNKENVLMLRYHHTKNNLETFKAELNRHADIQSVGGAHYFPYNWTANNNILPEGKNTNETIAMDIYNIDYDFIETLGIKISGGRSFSKKYSDMHRLIITRHTAEKLGWDEPVGKHLTIGEHKSEIIGVSEDFHFRHLFFKKAPCALILNPNLNNYIYIKISGMDKVQELIPYIKEQWNVFMPGQPFDYSVLKESFRQDFDYSMRKADQVFAVISLVTVFISCLGLFGLASFDTERNKKEIGIRKVLGASVNSIIARFLNRFLKLIIIANIIAIPMAYFMSKFFLNLGWIASTDLGAGMFALSVLISLFSAGIAVFTQVFKAAFANPVNTLRYE